MARGRPTAQRFERRLFAGLFVTGMVGALIVARLVQVQFLLAAEYKERAESQQNLTLELPAVRGAVLDRHDRPLAFTRPADRRNQRGACRLYPLGTVGAQVVGFCSPDGVGREGIELACNRVLSGKPGSRLVGVNARRVRFTPPEGRIRPSEDGATVVLTLDADMQSVVERELKDCVERTGAVAATAVLLDPRTGDVLAMGSFPGYDPQDYQVVSPEHRRNRAITDIHEPGSTFKVVTVAACLEEGLVRPDTEIPAKQELELADGRVLRDKKDYGAVSVGETLVLSVNTATAQLARRLGAELLFQYARAFGFGCVTGIELPGEVSGILRRPAHWSGRSLETISIGQEVAVTPLQLACAYAAVANGGLLLKPRIVREIRDPSGKVLREYPWRRVRRVISRETARALTEILATVVEEGTGRKARIPGVAVAGKTGTAQRIDPQTGRYDPRRHVSSFVGFLPAGGPRLVGVVVVDRPDGVGYGGQVAAPCFRRIMEGILLTRPSPAPFEGAVLASADF